MKNSPSAIKLILLEKMPFDVFLGFLKEFYYKRISENKFLGKMESEAETGKRVISYTGYDYMDFLKIYLGKLAAKKFGPSNCWIASSARSLGAQFWKTSKIIYFQFDAPLQRGGRSSDSST